MASRDGRTLRELVDQPWTIKLRELPDGRHAGRVEELEGCEAVGDTTEATLEALKKERSKWLRNALAHGRDIPSPRPTYSGKIFIRTTPKLHELVAREASFAGVSMSQWVSEVLAREVGAQEVKRVP